MKKVLFFAALFGLMLVSSCNKKELDVTVGKSECLLTVHTIAYDSHEPIKNITLEIMGLGKAATTNEQGVATFTLPVGNYELKVMGEGYAGIVSKIYVNIDNNESDTPMVGNQTVDINMYPLIGLLKGNVTINRNGKVDYQSDVKLRVMPSEYSNVEFIAPITAVSGGIDGSYSIENLPIGLPLDISAEFIENNAIYRGGTDETEPILLKEELVLTAPTIKLTKTGNIQLPDIVVQPANRTAPLVLKFSTPVDIEKVVVGNIIVKDENGYNVGITCQFKDNNKTLEINTIDRDNGWRIGTTNDYSYSISILNISGDMYIDSGNFGVSSSLTGDIPVLNISYNKGSDALSWERTANAEVYDIYVKREGISDYILLLGNISVPPSNPNNPSINAFFALYQHYYNNRLNPDDYDFYYFKIIGRNSAKQGDLTSAVATKIEYTTILPPVDLSYNANSKTFNWTKQVKDENYTFYILDADGNEVHSFIVSKNDNNSPSQSMKLYEVIPSFISGGTYSVKAISSSYNTAYNLTFSGNKESAVPIEVEYTNVLPPLTVSYSTSTKTLSWTKQINAETYGIYVVDNGGYSLLADVPEDITATTTQSINLFDLLWDSGYGDGTYAVKMIAKGTTFPLSGSLDEATSISVNYVAVP